MDKTAPIPEASDGHRVWLRVGALLDGVSTAPLRDAHVVYQKDQILYVGASSPPPHLVRAAQSAPDADLPAFTLLPGLIEAHAHFFLQGGELNLDKRAAFLEQSPQELLRLARLRLEKLVRIGVAGVRDAGDKDGVGLALSKLYASGGHPLMPYVDSPGAAIHHRGRYGGFMAEPIESFSSPRACVEARVKAGADRIKLIPTGIINFKKGAVTAAPQMTTQEVAALVAAAREFGRQTLAHASGDAGIEHVIDGGVDSLEHGFFVRDDQLAKMRDRQVAWVPTFAPVQKQVDHADAMGWDASVVTSLKRILENHAASLVNAHAMGVQVVAGSDAGSTGVAHGLGLLEEMELMERAGISSLAVINSATGAGSNQLSFKEKFGQIKAGYRARFMVTRHSPFKGVANLRKQRFVVFDGAVFAGDEHADFSGL